MQVQATASSDSAFDEVGAQAEVQKMYEQQKKTYKDEYERTVATQLDVQPNVNQFLANEVNGMRAQFGVIIRDHIDKCDKLDNYMTDINDKIVTLHDAWTSARVALSNSETQYVTVDAPETTTDVDNAIDAWMTENERMKYEVTPSFTRTHIQISPEDLQHANYIHDNALNAAPAAAVASSTSAAVGAGSGSGSVIPKDPRMEFLQMQEDEHNKYIRNALVVINKAILEAKGQLSSKNFSIAMQTINDAYMAQRWRFVQMMTTVSDYRTAMRDLYILTFEIMITFVKFMNDKLEDSEAGRSPEIPLKDLENWENGFDGQQSGLYGTYLRLIEHMDGDIINIGAFGWQWQQDVNEFFTVNNTKVKAEIDALRQRVRKMIATERRREANDADAKQRDELPLYYKFRRTAANTIDLIHKMFARLLSSQSRSSKMVSAFSRDDIAKIESAQYNMNRAYELFKDLSTDDQQRKMMLNDFVTADNELHILFDELRISAERETQKRWRSFRYDTLDDYQRSVSGGGVQRASTPAHEAYFDDDVAEDKDVSADADADDTALDDDPFAHIHPAAAVV
jgi:hypothetical protein